MRFKVYEPILVAGEDAFSAIDIRLRVKGGGHTSQVYAIRQAIAKAVVAYYAKYFDAASALELKKKLVTYDRTLLIADPRRMEPKKFGGQGARARRQKRSVVLPASAKSNIHSLPQLPMNVHFCMLSLTLCYGSKVYVYACASTTIHVAFLSCVRMIHVHQKILVRGKETH